jgi:hypothetical protein
VNTNRTKFPHHQSTFVLRGSRTVPAARQRCRDHKVWTQSLCTTKQRPVSKTCRRMVPFFFFFFFKIHLENAAAVCSLVSSHLLCVAATAICGGGVDSFNDGMHSAAEQRACRSLVELGHPGSDDESLRWYTGSVVR